MSLVRMKPLVVAGPVREVSLLMLPKRLIASVIVAAMVLAISGIVLSIVG
jgi:hypothetical protein